MELANTTKTVVSEFMSSGVLAFLVSELCVPNFGVPDLGFSELQVSELQIREFQDFGVPDFGAPDFGVPNFGVPDFGVPGFGAPNFGVPSFGIPQVRSSNFSTHEFDCSGSSGVGRHYKNSGFGIHGFRSLVFLASELAVPDFRSSRPRIFGVPDLRNLGISSSETSP